MRLKSTLRVYALVDRLFRHEAAYMTATLTRILGAGRIELVEDVVQEAVLAALGHWPRDGIPVNPTAWLVQVAKRRALDVIRRERMTDARERTVQEEVERWGTGAPRETSDDPVLLDDQLRMIFTCCHPEIPPDTRVTLTLKLAGGFGASEIARAYLAEETAIHQRLVRAKRRIREAGLAYAEAAEVIGGYFAIEAADYDEAVAIARSCPHIKYSGRIEVREVDVV
ncbi:MAG: sigma-70 family RNA polymerase sigma factor [Gemmatimonadaceae bacterium]